MNMDDTIKDKDCKKCVHYEKHKVKLNDKRGWEYMYVCNAVYECDYKERGLEAR